MPNPSPEHDKLARQLSEDYYEHLLAYMPQICHAVQLAAGDASFTGTSQFTRRKGKKGKKGAADQPDKLLAIMKPRVRTPIEPVEHEIEITKSKQLALVF